MRGWIVALSVLGIATASTGSLIGERSRALYTEQSAVGSDARATVSAKSSGQIGGEIVSGDIKSSSDTSGMVASAVADTGEEPDETSEPKSDAKEEDVSEPAAPAESPRSIPSILDIDPSKLNPLPVRPAPRVEVAPPPAPTEPLAVVCMAGCGPKTVVYEAVPKPSRPERITGVVPAVVSDARPIPGVIECVAGCYGSTPRSYNSPARARSSEASHADVGDAGYLSPRSLHGSRGASVRIQSGTRTRRVGY